MSFDAKQFLKEKFTPRTEAVPVPDLAAWFGEAEKPLWTVRGLTGQELGRANEAAERNRNIAAILEGLVGGGDKEKSQAVRDLVGIGGGVPQDIAKRLELLVIGSVDPPCTLDLAVRLCEAYPIEFFLLTTKISELTGRGQLPGKRTPSGETVESGPASGSATPGGASSTKPGRTSSRRAT